MKTWKRRNLTPLGRITVFKTLLLSKLNHLFLALPNPDANIIKELIHLCMHFFWKGKTDKIKREISVQKYNKGASKIKCNCFYNFFEIYMDKKINGKWKRILDSYIERTTCRLWSKLYSYMAQ